MTTEKQIRANRRNALGSTGPGPQGMRVSCMNATKHGLLSKHLLVREDDRPIFEKFSQQIREELQPLGPTESVWVELLITDCWRLGTCLSIEKNTFDFYRVYKDSTGDASVAFAHDASQKNSLTRLSRYASRFQLAIHKDLAELRQLQARPSRPQAAPQNQDPPVDSDAAASNSAVTDSGISGPVVTTSGTPPLLPTKGAATGKDADPAPLRVLSAHAVISDEDPAEFEAFRDALTVEWNARTALKRFLIELFAVNSWRLARLSRVEAGLFKQCGFDGEDGRTLLTAFVEDALQNDCFSKLGACETQLRNGLSRILKELLN